MLFGEITLIVGRRQQIYEYKKERNANR